MKPIYVFRAEDNHGKGAFSVTSFDTSHYTFLNGKETHPLPEEEGLTICKSLVCGVMTIKLFHHWFSNKAKIHLAIYGVKAAVYSANEYYIGETQCLFHHHKATLIKRVDIEKVNTLKEYELLNN